MSTKYEGSADKFYQKIILKTAFSIIKLNCSFLNEQQNVYYHANTCGNEKD